MISLSEVWQAIEGRVVELIHRTEARGARVYNSGTQTITAGANTALTFNTELYDTDEIWDVSNPTQLVATRDGYYMGGGSFYLAAAQVTSADRISLSVRKNGVTYVQAQDLHTINGMDAIVGVATGMFWLADGDYIELVAWNDFAANKTVSAASLNAQAFCCGWLMRVG